MFKITWNIQSDEVITVSNTFYAVGTALVVQNQFVIDCDDRYQSHIDQIKKIK